MHAKQDYKPREDPSRFKSTKTGRGPLIGPNWERGVDPVMCCYKLVTVEFKWWGLQNKIEKFIHRVMTVFHWFSFRKQLTDFLLLLYSVHRLCRMKSCIFKLQFYLLMSLTTAIEIFFTVYTRCFKAFCMTCHVITAESKQPSRPRLCHWWPCVIAESRKQNLTQCTLNGRML